MKKILLGFISAAMLISSTNVFASEVIKSSEFNNIGIRFNGELLNLNNNLLTVKTYGKNNVVNYMPVRDVLERMGYIIKWNRSNNTIEVLSKSPSLNSINLDENKTCKFSNLISRPTIINPYITFNGEQELLEVENVKKIIMHHTTMPEYNLYDIHEYHQSLGWYGFGYNYYIDFEGNIFEGAGPHIGAHARSHNSTSIGIAFQGDFTQQEMTKEQFEAGVKLTAWLICVYGLDPEQIDDIIVGHKDVGSTLCPGDNFRMEDLRLAIQNILLN